MAIQVYLGAYEFTLGNLDDLKIEDREVSIAEMEELLRMVGDLRMSPIARSNCEKVQLALEQRRSGVAWKDLVLGLQFAVTMLRLSVQAHVQKLAKEVKEASP